MLLLAAPSAESCGYLSIKALFWQTFFGPLLPWSRFLIRKLLWLPQSQMFPISGFLFHFVVESFNIKRLNTKLVPNKQSLPKGLKKSSYNMIAYKTFVFMFWPSWQPIYYCCVLIIKKLPYAGQPNTIF